VTTLARTWLALPRLESRAEPRDAGDWLTPQVIGAMVPVGSGKNLSWPPAVSGAAPSLMTFDAQGRLRPVAVQGTSSWPPPRKHSCWPVSIAAAPAGTSIPMSGTLYRPEQAGQAIPAAPVLG
jgi:hypothetical protein